MFNLQNCKEGTHNNSELQSGSYKQKRKGVLILIDVTQKRNFFIQIFFFKLFHNVLQKYNEKP